MTHTIVSRCYRRLAAALRHQTRAFQAYGETRRWRRGLLRSLRRRSRE